MRRFVPFLAGLLVFSCVSFADTFNWSYSGTLFAASGTLQATPNGDGTFTAVSGTGVLSYAAKSPFYGAGTADLTLVADPNAPGGTATYSCHGAAGSCNGGGSDLIYDDQLIPVAVPVFNANSNGLVFFLSNLSDPSFAPPVGNLPNGFNPWNNGAALAGGGTLAVDMGSFTATNVPDGGMTIMLLGGALVGVETLRRRFWA